MEPSKALTIAAATAILFLIAYFANKQGLRSIDEKVKEWAAKNAVTILSYKQVNPLIGTYPGPRLWWKGAWLVTLEGMDKDGNAVRGWLIPGNPFAAPELIFYPES